MNTKTTLFLIIAAATTFVVYMCWNKQKEWLDIGLGTGMLNYGIGSPSYEGFKMEESNETKKAEGFCGACS